MRIFHLADLHIGKIVNGFSMIKQQQYILDQIIDHVSAKKPDVIMIAGDVYDKANPSNEAVSLFSEFITKLSSFDLDILIVAGNHDSGDKLEFLAKILNRQRIYITGKFDVTIKKVSISDEFGMVNFYLMPFVRPSDVRVFYPKTQGYHSAIETALNNTEIDYSLRNIFIGHQFFMGSDINLERSDSELISVGGIDSVGYKLLTQFDYAAFGHLHKAQKVKMEYIRYSGSPLKYSDSEVSHNKSFVLIDIFNKGELSFELIKLIPEIEMRSVKGYIEDILNSEYDKDQLNDFVHVILLDDGEIIDAIGKLKNKYPNLMSLRFDNIKSRNDNIIDVSDDIALSNPTKLFHDFFKLQHNRSMSKSQKDIVDKIITREDL